MDGPDPDSGTCWEVGSAFSRGKPAVLVRTDIRTPAGNAGTHNTMLAHAASMRINIPLGSATEVIAAILDALLKIERRGAASSSR